MVMHIIGTAVYISRYDLGSILMILVLITDLIASTIVPQVRNRNELVRIVNNFTIARIYVYTVLPIIKL